MPVSSFNIPPYLIEPAAAMMQHYTKNAFRACTTVAGAWTRHNKHAQYFGCSHTRYFNQMSSTEVASSYGHIFTSATRSQESLSRTQNEKRISHRGRMQAQADFSTQVAESREWSSHELIADLRILMLTNSFNSMAQRAFLEIKDTYNSDVRIEIAIDEKQMLDAVERHQPDIILCPFLTKRVPEKIWKDTSRLCLIVHPGIHGDRGASSIDWALKDRHTEWGVTVLQADEEMDAGDIWSTKNFRVPDGTTKSLMYGSLVVDTAMDAIHEALEKFVAGEKGTPLDYSDPSVKGTLRDNMKISDRVVDFNCSATEVASAIRLSDSAPGAPHTIEGHKVFLYDAHVDESELPTEITPGMLIEKRNEAVRIACGKGSVWITHMKGRGKDSKLPRIKLPSTQILPQELIQGVPEASTEPIVVHENEELSNLHKEAWRDMWASVSDSGVATLHFPFLNGAMSTDQCYRITSFFQDLSSREDVKMIVLAGGRSAWSNGINLNTIEASDDPALESWENINAINDFVKAIFSTDKVTIAALQGNAGAGGVMAALACDYVWAHGKTVLNPHYKSMGLHGSEYWTYFLPKRVGYKMANKLTEDCMPVSAKTAEEIGMVDAVVADTREDFMESVRMHAEALVRDNGLMQSIQSSKQQVRTEEWHEFLQGIRDHELRIMRENFVNEEYIRARKNFVHKMNPTSTPLHLTLNQYRPHILEIDGNVDMSKPSKAIYMDGNKVAKTHLESLTKTTDSLKENDTPKMAVLIVSGNADSERYVNQKVKTAKKVGVLAEVHRFESDHAKLEDRLIEKIKELNESNCTNGIMVQLPLPAGVDKYKVLAAVSPLKDVDGFAAANLGSIICGSPTSGASSSSFAPCTAKGIMSLLDHYSVNVTGKNVVVIGRSCIVGLPTQLFLMKRGATVTNCDINTTGLREIVQSADVVVASAGSPELVKADWIKPGAVVIDAGFHVMEELCNVTGNTMERIVGDVEAKADQVASLMTPVPGGVGPMTVAMLLDNTVQAFLNQQNDIPARAASYDNTNIS